MSKYSPILLVIAGALFYVTAFTTQTSKGAYVALGTVFIVLGIAAFRRQSRKK